jgi:hypothetical protein
MARDEDEAAVERAARRIAELQKAKPDSGKAKTAENEAASRRTEPKKA